MTQRVTSLTQRVAPPTQRVAPLTQRVAPPTQRVAPLTHVVDRTLASPIHRTLASPIHNSALNDNFDSSVATKRPVVELDAMLPVIPAEIQIPDAYNIAHSPNLDIS